MEEINRSTAADDFTLPPTKKSKKGKEKETSRARWTETQREELVALLVEYGGKEHRSDNGWNNRAWNEITTKWTAKFPNANYTRVQIKDQEQHLKKKFKSLKQLMTSSGLGWNPSLKMVDAEKEVWKEILKTNKEARQWQNKKFPYYEDLYDLYKGCIAEGLNKRSSNYFESPYETPSPTLHSPNEHHRFSWEDEFLNTQNTSPNITNGISSSQPIISPIIDLASEDPVEMSLPETENISPPAPLSSRTTRQPSPGQEGQPLRAGRNKKAKTTKAPFSPFNEDYYAFKREETKLYISAMKEIKEKEGSEKYGINAAMTAFKELKGFSFDDFDKATTLFMSSPEIREAFISFEPDHRAIWIRNKINGV